MEKILFKEEQRFIRWWLLLILLSVFAASTVPFLYGIYSQEVLEVAWGDNPTSTTNLVIILLFDVLIVGGVSIFVFKMRLIVEIRGDSIRYKYPPQISKWKSISKKDIMRYKLREYKPIVEYGGWGVKGKKNNKSLTVKGNHGLQIYFIDGKGLLIGTQRKQAMIYAMDKMMNIS